MINPMFERKLLIERLINGRCLSLFKRASHVEGTVFLMSSGGQHVTAITINWLSYFLIAVTCCYLLDIEDWAINMRTRLTTPSLAIDFIILYKIKLD